MGMAPPFFVLQNTLRTLLQQRYAQHRGYEDRAAKRAYSLTPRKTDMPNSVAKQLAALVGNREFESTNVAQPHPDQNITVPASRIM
jgi:hypothetical protein